MFINYKTRKNEQNKWMIKCERLSSICKEQMNLTGTLKEESLDMRGTGIIIQELKGFKEI